MVTKGFVERTKTILDIERTNVNLLKKSLTSRVVILIIRIGLKGRQWDLCHPFILNTIINLKFTYHALQLLLTYFLKLTPEV